MREVNFSIPNVNKASVNITTTLYDRRALDCTSTLPLVNSLNHLAYLTTSSARIRDILTVDGGVERLVCILKEGRSNDMMEMWKWNLALQCLVNIGVRGSETVRTRVVEADVVPVIATILDNFIRVMERVRAKAADADRGTGRTSGRSSLPRPSTRSRESGSRSFFDRASAAAEQRPSRRQAPPPSIEIPQPAATDPNVMDTTPIPQFALTSPPERTTFTHAQRDIEGRHGHRHQPRVITQPATAVPSMDGTDSFGLRPVRDIDRLPSMLPASQAGLVSQPESPTTPGAPVQARASASQASRSRRRPSIRQQRSTSRDSDDANGDESMLEEDVRSAAVAEPLVDIQNEVDMEDVPVGETILGTVAAAHALTGTTVSDAHVADGFNMVARTSVDGSIGTAATTTVNFSPVPAAVAATTIPNAPTNHTFSYLRDRGVAPAILAIMPRDEDVLMSLQLLAYVSKYCNLRSYFQKTHLVPKLKLARELTEDFVPGSNFELEEQEEYLLPDDVNIFPMVEKFTVRHHSKDMQYWACVVMRNLCRKDDTRGGIRQCAYYACGKWEEFQRQFAKCRRCRRTKYCSKECQKSAWVYHRHWCHDPPA